MTSRKRHKPKWPRVAGLLLGAALAVLCTYLPPDYQAACEILSQITSLTCGA